MTGPTGIGRPRVIVDVIEHRGSLARCPHCRRLAERLLVIDDGDRDGPAIACADCVERAGGPLRAEGGATRG